MREKIRTIADDYRRQRDLRQVREEGRAVHAELAERYLQEQAALGSERRYYMYKKNVELESARVVCIGETHPYVVQNGRKVKMSDSTRKTVDAIITTIAKPGDVLLIERVQRGKRVGRFRRHLLQHHTPSWLETRGWDDMRLRREALALYDRGRNEEAHWVNRRFDALSGSWIRECTNDAIEHANVVAMQRNGSMMQAIRTVEEKLPEDNKVIVVAGSDHFEESKSMIDWLGQYKFCVLMSTR